MENAKHELHTDAVAGGVLSCTSDHFPLALMTWQPKVGAEVTDEIIAEVYRSFTRELRDRSLVVLLERVFARRDTAPGFLKSRDNAIKTDQSFGWREPTFVEGVPCRKAAVAGIHIVAARPRSDVSIKTIEWEGQVAGVEVLGEHAHHIALTDVARLLPSTERTDGAVEAEQTILLAQKILAQRGWSLHDVQRTWFYLKDILSWYDDFNRARNGVFDCLGLDRDGTMVIPASTGISGVGLRDGWCVLDLLATRAVNGAVHEVARLSNPRQNEAPEYGSAFSRGLCLTTDATKILLVSGTASIDDDGLSTNFGDFRAQANASFDTVDALLGTAGASISEISQATAFVKKPDDVPKLARILAERGMADLPIVCTIADVCREELLFEIDASLIL